MAGFPTSRHSLDCSMIAEEKGKMQRDDWYSSARVPSKVADPEALGRYAGERALARLRARKLGLETTGSAGGNQNLGVKPGTDVGAHRRTRPLSHHARLFQQAQGNRRDDS